MQLMIFMFTILFSVMCFGQANYTTKPGESKALNVTQLYTGTIEIDSMDIKIISMKEFNVYLERINMIAQKQFDISQMAKYNLILIEIQKVYKEADIKRRKK